MGGKLYLKLDNPHDGSYLSFIQLPEGGMQITILADGHHMSVFHHVCPADYVWVDCTCQKQGERYDGLTSFLDLELDETHEKLRQLLVGKMRLPESFY